MMLHIKGGGGDIISNQNHIAAQIKRDFTGKYKEMFGKGPENTTVDIVGDVVIIKLEGFMTPLERTMYEHSEGAEVIDRIRDFAYKTFVTEIEMKLKCLTDKGVTKVIKSANLEKDKEYIFIIMEGVIGGTG